MSLRVVAPGLFSLPVGPPRPGRRALGISPGGPADRGSFALANALVGNPPDTPAVEVSLFGPTLIAACTVGAVVFGAPFEVFRDGEPIPPNHTFTLQAGSTLRIAGTPAGCRAYLAVPGGFGLPPVPTPLAADDVLTCGESALPARSIMWHRHSCLCLEPSQAGLPVLLRVLPGPQRDWFPDGSFFSHIWTVGDASNRMGVRLAGEQIPKRVGELASEPVAAGAVQVLNDGRPVILGADGQTIGGYPKVAHVIRADLDRVGQLRPGEAVRFEVVTLEEAEMANRAKWAELRQWELRLSVAGGEVFTKFS